ncbi:hypothetical protein CDL15_Pgr019705 [Punica granatum]|uniref:O-methyltransferase domain-containing protein n=1 Tax=Punica granatum TaxID=22663 RepID=A0A218X5B5_PUNGR|nr:hypothetical protein CDL15_Pgr019705 [Punica granatum]PKI52845.1 hypothetical protein CRG98_026676 [Punica granatum]
MHGLQQGQPEELSREADEMRLVRVGGVIVYNNTLWGGTVALPDVTPIQTTSRGRAWQNIVEFNKMIAADLQVDISQAATGDGITICRRIY